MAKKKILSSVALLIFALTLASCGGGSSGTSNTTGNDDGDDGGWTPASGETITISGTMDGSTIASSLSLPQKLLKGGNSPLRSLIGKAEAEPTVIDAVAAVSNDMQTFEIAELDGENFELTLDKDKPYLLLFLNGTDVEAIYQVDENTDLDAFPVFDDSNNLDLGTISIDDSGRAQGSIAETDTLEGLGTDSETASAFGVMDDGLQRFSSIDVDGNGQVDFQENKQFNLRIDFEFDSNTNAVTDIQDVFSDYTTTTFNGYMYYFWAQSDNLSDYDWNQATLHAPEDITGDDVDVTNDIPKCYPVDATPENNSANLNFFCGGAAHSPVTPPAGTYTVNVPALAEGGEPLVLTFSHVKTQTIDENLYNIYVPSVKLTMSDNHITQIDWMWWKKTPDGWVNPSDTELASVMSSLGFEIGQTDWVGDRASVDSNDVPLTSIGQVVVPAQGFDVGKFRASFIDQAGYHYGMEFPTTF